MTTENLTVNRTLVKTVQWLLVEVVVVGPEKFKSSETLDFTSSIVAREQGITLTVQPGVTIAALPGSALIISRGSRINAVGSREEPIYFESIDEGYDGDSEWGGLVLLGLAPSNQCDSAGSFCNIEQEGGIGYAGGNRVDDDSGELHYVVIAESGNHINEEIEINGLTLSSVGTKTKLSYIQIHNSGDDGIEIFGGAPFLKHIIVSDFGDDGIDWNYGYQGGIQHALITTHGHTDRGIEADNSSTSHYDDMPLSMPTLSNVTIYAKQQSESSYGLFLRSGSGGYFDKLYIARHDTCMRISSTSSERTVDGRIYLNDSLFSCRVAMDSRLEPNGFSVLTQVGDAIVPNADTVALSFFTTTEFGAPSMAGSQSGLQMPEGFFDSTNYIGAIDPYQSQYWWSDWTIPFTD